MAKRKLCEAAAFLLNQHTRAGCMTIQGALVRGHDSAPVREDLIALRRRSQNALRQRFKRAQRDGDLAKTADAADLARFISAVYQSMTVQSINGASRKELLRLADAALRVWPHSPG